MTHSAASQTAAQMARHGLLTLGRGADARQRIARLTARAHELLPVEYIIGTGGAPWATSNPARSPR